MDIEAVPERALAMVGQTRTRSHHVTEHEIMRFAQASGCKAAWRGNVLEAPLLFTQALTYESLPVDQLPPDGSPRELDVPLPASRTVGGSSDYEIFRKIKAGETITITSSVKDIKAKQGRSGLLFLVEVETRFADADGDEVAVEVATYVKKAD